MELHTLEFQSLHETCLLHDFSSIIVPFIPLFSAYYSIDIITKLVDLLTNNYNMKVYELTMF